MTEAKSPQKLKLEFNDQPHLEIEYPAIVENDAKALETLKGEETITRVYNDEAKRLPLFFRPRDPYCKSVLGDRSSCTNLILKVVKKKIRTTEGERIDYKATISGVAEVSYKFRALMDYQYLPMQVEGDKVTNLLPKIIPKGIPPVEWLREPIPTFIQPHLFSRSDTVSPWHGKDESKMLSVLREIVDNPNNASITTRFRQSISAYFLNFGDAIVPKEPKVEALEYLKLQPYESEVFKKLKKLFEERPIWTRTELIARLRVTQNRLKALLPVVAYYFLCGPWRGAWVKFCYDPRKNPEAKMFQTLDFRVRQELLCGEDSIPQKRSTYSSKFQDKLYTIQTKSPSVIEAEKLKKSNNSKKTKPKTIAYIFNSDSLPKYRQSFYQLYNIQVPEIQELVKENDGKESTECHEKDGWCLPLVLEKIRDIMNNSTKKTLRQLSEDGKISQDDWFQNIEGDQELIDDNCLGLDEILEYSINNIEEVME